MVQDTTERRGIAEVVMQAQYPSAYAFLRRFARRLRTRSLYTKYFDDRDPFYSMYNVAEYTFAPYKVVWMDLSDRVKAAAVISETEASVPIPEHKLLMAAVGSADEAYYLAGVLNSDIVGLVVMNYTVDSSISTHPLRNIVIPLFDSTDLDHVAVASLSRDLHLAAANGSVEPDRPDECNLNFHVERLMQRAAAAPEHV